MSDKLNDGDKILVSSKQGAIYSGHVYQDHIYFGNGNGESIAPIGHDLFKKLKVKKIDPDEIQSLIEDKAVIVPSLDLEIVLRGAKHLLEFAETHAQTGVSKSYKVSFDRLKSLITKEKQDG
ncbi:hypothetical protein GWO43_30220 [candidate division KSB1 bacterium]|nr:hypothetical protein [candidate division KSB1 bacterium]NIV70634.1 hypothetical protein [Phycisphaerae bacterium]NIS28167.1 hypothetical protein [candidate division KSB1 bacterium]NIT75059.1 hypothetical protein [candidate division KSB1 bacterium]NIU28845.1 hypothetical protein [candidate division KSB1 bacterium]